MVTEGGRQGCVCCYHQPISRGVFVSFSWECKIRFFIDSSTWLGKGSDVYLTLQQFRTVYDLTPN